MDNAIATVCAMEYARARALGSSREDATRHAGEAAEDFRAWAEAPAPAPKKAPAKATT